MKAMILAAGYGTRLKPFTDEKPKALTEINGIPLLQFVIKKLISAGVSEIIINTHHLADQITSFIQKNNNFGIHIEFSHELDILGTGGGLKKASYFFDNGQPFFLHNVDILSTIDLTQMYNFHLKNHALATVAIQRRDSSRYFIVDDRNYICGHEDAENKRTRLTRQPQGEPQLMAFCGIHVISPAIFDFTKASVSFSIVDVYLKLIEQGFLILGFPSDQFYWKDIGKLETLNEVHHDFETGAIQIDSLTK